MIETYRAGFLTEYICSDALEVILFKLPCFIRLKTADFRISFLFEKTKRLYIVAFVALWHLI